MMEQIREQLEELLDKEELSSEEKNWLLNYIENTDQHELQEILQHDLENSSNDTQPLNTFLSAKMLREIHKKAGIGQQRQTIGVRVWLQRIAIAASVTGI